MKIEMHSAAEIHAEAMDDSFHEPVVQAALATELQSEAVQTAAQPQQQASSKWTTLWQALTHAWDVADEHLANWFGLNESKYEWAVREYYWQKREEEEQNEILQTAAVQMPSGPGIHHTRSAQAEVESEALQGSAMV